MKPIVRLMALMTCLVCLVPVGAALAQTKTTKDPTALRRQCAHLVKVRMGIKETGSSTDLQGVRGAVAMVDQCVANGGKF
jgi:hypothetical protein